MIPILKKLLTSESAARAALLGAAAFSLTPEGQALMGSAALYVALAGAVLGGGITAGEKNAKTPAE